MLALVPPVPGPVGPRCWVARRARIGALTSTRSSLISHHLAGRHRNLDRFGEAQEEVRAAFDSPGGWPGLLAAFAEATNA